MSNSTIWAPSPKFRGYEVSRTELVRNIKTKRIVPQRIDPFDKDRRPRVTVAYRDFPIEIFVQEIVNNAFGVIKE